MLVDPQVGKDLNTVFYNLVFSNWKSSSKICFGLRQDYYCNLYGWFGTWSKFKGLHVQVQKDIGDRSQSNETGNDNAGMVVSLLRDILGSRKLTDSK